MQRTLEGLTDHQQAFLRNYSPPQLFYVISWGCAATSWLSTVLNRHPDIFCVHAANLAWHVLAESKRLDGVPYLHFLSSQGRGHIAAGEVHGASRHLVPECRRSFGDKFNAAVVVREPITRLHSQLALFQDFQDVPAWNLDYAGAIADRAGIKLGARDYSARFFVHAANMLNAVLEEREVGKIYRSEDLTSDGNVLGDFIEEITRGKVSPASGWLQSAIESKKLNVHAGSKPRSEFDSWQIDVIRRVVDPRAWDIYESLDYSRPEFISGSQGEIYSTSNGVTCTTDLPALSRALTSSR